VDALDDDEVEALGAGGWVVRDRVLGPAAASVAAAIAALDGGLTPAQVGRGAERQAVPTVRGDRTRWIDPGAPPPGLDPLITCFHTVRDVFNAAAWLGLDRLDVQLAAYPAGAGYDRHLDAFRGRGSRRLTAIWYANPGWTDADGGALRVWRGDAAFDLSPTLDRLVVFLADRVPHAVQPGARVRRAATAWFHGRDDPA